MFDTFQILYNLTNRQQYLTDTQIQSLRLGSNVIFRIAHIKATINPFIGTILVNYVAPLRHAQGYAQPSDAVVRQDQDLCIFVTGLLCIDNAPFRRPTNQSPSVRRCCTEMQLLCCQSHAHLHRKTGLPHSPNRIPTRTLVILLFNLHHQRRRRIAFNVRRVSGYSFRKQPSDE